MKCTQTLLVSLKDSFWCLIDQNENKLDRIVEHFSCDFSSLNIDVASNLSLFLWRSIMEAEQREQYKWFIQFLSVSSHITLSTIDCVGLDTNNSKAEVFFFSKPSSVNNKKLWLLSKSHLCLVACWHISDMFLCSTSTGESSIVACLADLYWLLCCVMKTSRKLAN